jgi:pimeloyl-ACP methyl ester carboxylesterase
MRAPSLVLLCATLLALPCAVPPARAVEPGADHTQRPADLGLQAEDVTFAAADSATVNGWWFPGPKDAPVIVVAPRGSGTMAGMLPSVKELLARGFQVLTFDYRGFGPGSSAGARDSLRYIIFSSGWVDDMDGALRYARARGGRHVFAWGQDLGSAVALAGAARDSKGCDAVAVEGLFRTSQELLLANGTSVIEDVPLRHRRLVRGPDEPLSAACLLRVPLFAVLAGKDTLTPPATTKAIAARNRLRADVWFLPNAGHAGAEQTPGYFDRLARWFKQWVALPPGSAE